MTHFRKIKRYYTGAAVQNVRRLFVVLNNIGRKNEVK